MAWASMAWDLALTIFSRHFREMWRGESVFSKFSLPLNCGYKAIKNFSIVVRRPNFFAFINCESWKSHSNSFEPQLPCLIPSDLLVQIRGRSDLWI